MGSSPKATSKTWSPKIIFPTEARLGEPSDGGGVLKVRALARYTFPENKMWHVELIGDKSVATKNMPDEVSGALLLRYNFKP